MQNREREGGQSDGYRRQDPKCNLTQNQCRVHVRSNGEAERPHAGAGSEPWAHNVFPRPRRYY